MGWVLSLITILVIITVLFFLTWLTTGLITLLVFLTKPKKTTIPEFITEISKYFGKKQEMFDNYNSYLKYEKDSEEVSIINEKDLNLKGWLYKNPDQKRKKRTIILFAHGFQSSHKSDSSFIGTWMMENGFDTLHIDHQGHGESGGKTITFGIDDFKNIMLWVDYINQIYNDNVNIILYGLSMGANAVMLTADKKMKNVKGIIADCGFTNGFDQMAFTVKNRPIMYLVRSFLKLTWKRDLKQYSTLDTLKNSLYPVLFIHGKKDQIVPLKFSLQNFNVCTSKKEIYLADNAKHALSYIENPACYTEKAVKFINSCIE